MFEVPTGALADRFGRCRAMMLGSLLMAIGCVVDFNGRDFWTFALGEGLLALGMTLTSGADSAYLYDLLRSARQASTSTAATKARRPRPSWSAPRPRSSPAASLGRTAPAATYAATACVCAARGAGRHDDARAARSSATTTPTSSTAWPTPRAPS